MKKTIVFILAVTLIFMSGCQGKGYSEYKNALEQTNKLEQFETHWSMNLNFDYDVEGFDEEDVASAFEAFSEMKLEMIMKKDKKKGLTQAEAYLNYGNVGLDADYYVFDQGSYLSIPFLEKYISLIDIENQDFMPEDYSLILSERTLKDIEKLWLDTVTSDDVFKGESILIDTPDGSVKTTKYTIDIDDETFKIFIYEMGEILMYDEKFVENLSKQDIPDNFDFIKLLEQIDKLYLEEFTYEIYVDIDNYIVNELINVKINSDMDYLNSIDFRMESQLYKINKTIEFNFPIITKDQVMTFDELKEDEEFKEYLPDQYLED